MKRLSIQQLLTELLCLKVDIEKNTGYAIDRLDRLIEAVKMRQEKEHELTGTAK